MISLEMNDEPAPKPLRLDTKRRNVLRRYNRAHGIRHHREGRPGTTKADPTAEKRRIARNTDCREKYEEAQLPELTTAEQSALVRVAQRPAGQVRYNVVSAHVRQNKLEMGAFRILKSLFEGVGAQHRSSLIRFSYETLDDDVRSSIPKQDLANWMCCTEQNLKNITSMTCKNPFWKWEASLLTAKYKKDVVRNKTSDAEKGLYTTFFLDNSTNVSGDSTHTKQLSLQLHELQITLYAEFPTLLRKLLYKYASLADAVKVEPNTTIWESHHRCGVDNGYEA